MIPYAQKLISDYLRTHPDVTGLDARVVSKTPDNTATPWVRVTQLDARDQTEPAEHLIMFPMQLDCYAGKTGGLPEADKLARTVRAVLTEMAGTHAEGVVTGVRFTGMPRLPDDDFTPARERVVLDVEMYAHP